MPNAVFRICAKFLEICRSDAPLPYLSTELDVIPQLGRLSLLKSSFETVLLAYNISSNMLLRSLTIALALISASAHSVE